MQLETIAKRGTEILSGSVAGQLLVLAFMPALTRIYSPAEFGRIAVFILIGSLLQIIGSLRLDNAVLRSRDAAQSIALLRFALGSSVVVSAAVLVLALPLSLIDALPFPGTLWVLALALYTLTGSVYHLATGVCLKYGSRRLFLLMQLSLPAAAIVFQLGMGVRAPFAETYIVGLCIGYAVATTVVFCSIAIIRQATLVDPAFWRAHGLVSADVRAGMASFLVEALSRNSLSPLISMLGGFEIGGAFALAQRIVMNPVLIVCNALHKVCVQQFSEADATPAQDSVGAWRQLRALACALFGLSLIASVALRFGFAPVFGDAWAGAGGMAAALALLAAPVILFEVLSALRIVRFAQRATLLSRLVLGLVGIGVLLSSDPAQFPASSLLLYSAATFATLGVMLHVSLEAHLHTAPDLMQAMPVVLAAVSGYALVGLQLGLGPGGLVVPAAVAALVLGALLSLSGALSLRSQLRHQARAAPTVPGA